MRRVGGSKKSYTENGRAGHSIPSSIPKVFINGRVRRLELRAWGLWGVRWVEPKASSPNGLMYVHSAMEKSLHQSIPTGRAEDFGHNSVQDVLHYTHVLYLLTKCLSGQQVLYLPCTWQCWVFVYTAECRLSPGPAQALLKVALSSWQAHFSCFFREFCSEFCTVPGSKIARSKIQVLLGHAAIYHADRASLIFRWCSSPLLWDTSSGTSLDQLCT